MLTYNDACLDYECLIYLLQLLTEVLGAIIHDFADTCLDG